MYEASNNNMENWDTMERIIEECGLTGLDVLKYLTDWHGMDLLDYDFVENLIECEL